ncbi:MAG: hypothetical protein CVU39_10175 [Chloroflexi bacterium HGW-Chloroflexi-10]|nr:MAG: hypothetical protein CVU39_10175 [Chloroflexi bacterium HGW-Chloroflexi-10]
MERQRWEWRQALLVWLGNVEMKQLLLGIDDAGGQNKYNSTDCPGVNAYFTVNYLEGYIE